MPKRQYIIPMCQAKKELDFWNEGPEPRLRPVILLHKRHASPSIMWFIFHNLLKTLDKYAWNLLTVC
jgi:hypothetical protein